MSQYLYSTLPSSDNCSGKVMEIKLFSYPALSERLLLCVSPFMSVTSTRTSYTKQGFDDSSILLSGSATKAMRKLPSPSVTNESDTSVAASLIAPS